MILGLNIGNHFVQQTGNSAPQQTSQQQQQQSQQSPQQSQTQTQCHSTTTGIQHTGTPVQQLVTSSSAVMDRQVPIQITLPPQTGVPDAPLRVLTIQVPASAIQGTLKLFFFYYILLYFNIKRIKIIFAKLINEFYLIF